MPITCLVYRPYATRAPPSVLSLNFRFCGRSVYPYGIAVQE